MLPLYQHLPHRFNRLRPEQIFLIVQGVLAALAITPFGVRRLLMGDWEQALVDFGIVAMMATFALYGTLDRNFRLVSLLFALCYTIGSFAVIAMVGPEVIYWAFPAQVAVFFVVRCRDAFFIAFSGVLANTYLAYRTTSLFETSSFFVTDLLICIFAYIFSTRLTTDNQRLFLAANIDPLTRAGNRRSLDDTLETLLSAPRLVPSSLLMIDVDFFKGINDQFGHDTGDICLQRISTHLESRLTIDEPLFRYGGEEFIVLTNNPLDQAAILAEELRSHIETTQLIREQMITVSIGVTELVAGDTARGALNRVDEALYDAKRAGRNRVSIARPFARRKLELYA